MRDTIEFKINPLSNKQPWEALPIASTINIDKQSPIFFQMLNFEIERLTKDLGESCEIRWNWQGNYQGNYKDVAIEQFATVDLSTTLYDYDRGYTAGYEAGLQAALVVIQRPHFVEPTCPDCGHPLAGGGCPECE